ncbi:hypothetical protein [Pantoea agglomerans]|uniref:hypothetical protein n=1 Tax=Enterobacter agglomerans TaxID=549 RepID=UPI0013872773|nr:hypothetical protein [Pantoea agglomerans]
MSERIKDQVLELADEAQQKYGKMTYHGCHQDRVEAKKLPCRLQLIKHYQHQR